MNVYRLNKNEVKDIVFNWKFTKHAQVRLLERFLDNDSKYINMHQLENSLISQVFKTNFAYMNPDGFINVAVDKFTYLVVKPQYDNYLVITYKEKSRNNYTVFDKYKLALGGVKR